MPDAINAAGIPGANLRPDMVEIAAGEISGIGDKVGTQAATVVTTWQRLAAHYDAPEDTTLFGVMDPVKTNGETFDTNTGLVASALKVYAAEVEPIKAELAKIKLEAYLFLNSIAGGVEKKTANRMGDVSTKTVAWHEDQDSVDANNALIGRVNDQMELLWAAERKCANAIYDIIGFPHISAASEGNPNGYGVADIPAGAETPWGTTVEKTENCGEKTVGAVKGFVWDGVVVDGLWGTVVGLGSLTLGYNPQTGEWFDSETYAAGWSNLGMLGVGLLTAGPLTTPLIAHMPGPVGDFLRRGQETLVAAGKGLIAYDTWSEDPARAAGATVFNLGTIIIPVGAATAPVRVSASTAAAAIRTTAKVINVLDPISLVGGAAVRITMPSVSAALRALDLGGAGTRIDIPDLPPTQNLDIPTVGRPDMTVDTPRVDGDVDVPVRTPEDAVSVPPVREPALVGAGARGDDGGTTTVGGGGRGGGAGGSDLPGSGGAGGGSAGGGGSGAGAGGGDLPPSGAAGNGPVAPGGNGVTNGGAGVPNGTGGATTTIGTGPGTVPGGAGPGGTGPVPGGAFDSPNGNGSGGTSGGSTGGGGNGGGPTGGTGASGGGGTPWDPEMGDPTLSPADHGPDFVRDQSNRGNPVDPSYGQPDPNHGTLNPNYAPPPLDRVAPEVRDLVSDPDAPFGRGTDGQPYSRAEWEARYLDQNGRPVYPGNDGAVPGRRVDFSSADEFTAHYGDVLDRMGGRRGDFMAMPGTPFEHRALPGSNLSQPYLTMRLTGDLPPNTRIEVSEIAPAFGQPGGGLQVRVIELADDGSVRALPVDEMQRRGIVDVVGDTSRSAPNTPTGDQPNIHYSDRWDQPDADGGSCPDGDSSDGAADGPDSTPNPDPDSGGGALDHDHLDGREGDDHSRLNGAGHEPGLDPTPETIRTGMVRMEDHPDYPATVARLEELGYTVREAPKGRSGPNVDIVHIHEGATGPAIRVQGTVNVIPGMRYLDLEHEVGHVNQMTNTGRFPEGPPATGHAYYDESGQLQPIKGHFPVLKAAQDDIVEYHVRLEEYLRLHERGVPADVLDAHRGGLLEQQTAYRSRFRNKYGPSAWRDAHFADIPSLEARLRALDGGPG